MATISLRKIKTNELFSNIVAVTFALRAVTFVWLAFASSVYSPLYANLQFFIRIVTIPLGFLYVCQRKSTSTRCLYALAPLVMYWIMLVIHTYGGYEGSYLHELVSIGCFLLMDKDEKVKIFRCFYWIVQACNIIAIIIWVACFLNIPIGFSMVPFYNDGVETSVYTKWFIFAVQGDRKYALLRLCGIFNEPGALGTVCALMFSAIYSNSKKWEKTLLIVTIVLSFSVAGYILLLVYLAMYYGQKSWKYALLAIVPIVLLLLIPYIDWGSDILNAYAQRFSIVGGSFVGDNRIKVGFAKEYEELKAGSDIFFGKGATYTAVGGTASYKNFIMQFGVVGFVLYFGLWIIAALKVGRGNRMVMLLLAVFLLSIYQRPVTITNSYGYFLFFGAAMWLTDKNSIQRVINKI